MHSAALANDLIVDARTLQMNDLATITVSLEGPFASLDEVDIPLQNLAFVGEASVSSEFAWINGEVVRRKTFRHRVRPLQPGRAVVGPVLLTAPDGMRQTLGAVSLAVLADRASASNDAVVVLSELLATGRDPLFVIAEAERTSVFVGEPAVVTWYLYNAATVQQWNVVALPKLDDFWTEDIPVRSENAERAFVGNALMQRVPIRRVVLYPLRSGSYRVGGMTVEAAVMRRVRSGPFGMYEGELIETTFTSAPVDVTVKPLPPGPPVDVVGEVLLACEKPRQRNNGPVVVEATLSGGGNLRAAAAPRFAGRVEGSVEVESGEVGVTREGTTVAMTRRWRYLVFPAVTGVMTVPELRMTAFVPSTGERKELRCEGATLEVVHTAVPRSAPEARTTPEMTLAPRSTTPWLAGGIGVLFLALVLPRLVRERKIRREVRSIVAGKSPAEIRASIDARLGVDPAKLLAERTDRGEAYRALRSLLDAAERERDLPVTESEVARRVREVLIASAM